MSHTPKKENRKPIKLALLILVMLVFLGFGTTWGLWKLFPDQVNLEIKKAGVTATIVGGSGLFLIVTYIYAHLFTKILKVITPAIILSVPIAYFLSESYQSDESSLSLPNNSTANKFYAPPEEKWDFDDSDSKSEFENSAFSNGPYMMQCGAYKTLEHAEERREDIAFQGILSSIQKKEGSSWYRVVLGPYELKRDAERDRHKLQRAKIEPCAVWKDTQYKSLVNGS